MKSANDFWEEARIELGYDWVFNYGQKEINVEPPGWDVHEMHEWAVNKLSRQIAVESGQAKEHAPGIIEYKNPHVYYVGQEKHEARIGDRWNAEICR